MIEVDEHEPAEIYRLLDMATDIDVGPWNMTKRHADYFYTGATCYCHGYSQYNCERKTWNDLNDLEAVEYQLIQQVKINPECHQRLYLEGVAEPAAKGLLIYSKLPGQNVMKSGLRGERQSAYKSIAAWLRQVRKHWEVVYTFSYSSTATTILADYGGDQKDEDQHSTFKRAFKDIDYKISPMAQRILGASGTLHFGSVAAVAVAAHFGTPWRAWKASVEEWKQVPGIGEATARAYLRGIGRLDV